MKYVKKVLPLILFVFLIGGCSKSVDEYNKPAIYWYTKIVDSISNSNLEKADDYYSSLQSEHIGSPLLPEATLILAVAHMQNEEYILSEYFFKEYIKRYADTEEKEFAMFMNIKAKYLSLPNPRRDQVLISEAIKESKVFLLEYPNSPYKDMVKTMLVRLYLAKASLNESISLLYKRIDKPKASAYYKAMTQELSIVSKHIEKAKTPWYREIFEGDGTASWYAFMIPDTISVVSRNSYNQDKNETK